MYARNITRIAADAGSRGQSMITREVCASAAIIVYTSQLVMIYHVDKFVFSQDRKIINACTTSYAS
jgi:hypothetical protein